MSSLSQYSLFCVRLSITCVNLPLFIRTTGVSIFTVACGTGTRDPSQGAVSDLSGRPPPSHPSGQAGTRNS